MKTSRELWNALEKKYKTEDAELKKFMAAKFLYFKMVDDKSVITQVQELQVIVHDLLAKAFQVATFIEKLHPLWKDFKNYLKYKRNEMTLEDLIVRLRIEEDNKATEKKSCGNSTIRGENIVEEASTSNRKRKKPACLVGNPKEWWIDSGATLHICANKKLFAFYVPVGPAETIFMGNSATTKIEGVGKISLKMTLYKVVTLNNVLHVPEIRKNL
uniref:Retrovirus-related Pol polyprotein from transposon TNT 1-94-like beta-barrel domain-containing protein n=1 Tax=Nicotiana tabacum TaxID=4097 RepID=A0A1S3Z0Z5_TOBAC